MRADKWVADMLRAGCFFDTSDPRKLIIPVDVAEMAGVLPGYFYIHELADGVALVEKYLPDGSRERLQ